MRGVHLCINPPCRRYFWAFLIFAGESQTAWCHQGCPLARNTPHHTIVKAPIHVMVHPR